jgi:aldehyde:ferredoxin oxidoreductase
MFAKKFMGERRFGAKTIFDELESRTDSLTPKNLLIFATGPFTSTDTSP